MRKIILTLLILFVFASVQAQPVLIKELPGYKGYDEKFFGANGKLYYIMGGDSLWKSDGTPSGTVFVKKIGEKVTEFYNEKPLVMGNNFFLVTISGSGHSLWRSDGTAANTIKIITYPFIHPMVIFKGEMYLDMNDGVNGRELFKMNSNFQFSLVKDLQPGASNGITRNPVWEISNNKLYFTAGVGYYEQSLWITDGTTIGTIKLFNKSEHAVLNLRDVNGMLYFSVDPKGPHHLYKTNGTVGETKFIASVGVGREFESGYIHQLISFKNKLYFFVNRSETEYDNELWMSNGINTYPITEGLGGWDSFVQNVCIIDDLLIFQTLGQGFVSAIFRSDGTNAGTYPIANYNSGYSSEEMIKVGNKIFYVDDGKRMGQPVEDYETYELWQVTPSIPNAKPVRQMFPNENTYEWAENFTEVNGSLFFMSRNKLWFYNPDKPSSNVPYFTLINADTDKDMQWLKESDTIVKPANLNINIRYNPVTIPGSVVFKLADTIRRKENGSPYSLAGDFSGNYSPWLEAKPGKHKLTAIPYSAANGTGVAGSATTVNFFIKQFIQKVPPVISAGADQEIILPKNSTMLIGSAHDPDGEVLGKEWLFLSGPEWPQYNNRDDDTLNIKNLVEGEYAFKFMAYDYDGFSVSDTVKIFVKKASLAPSNPRLVLVNAATDTDIRDMLNQDTIIYHSSTDKITIRAIPSKAIGSIVFFLNGVKHRTESTAPYALQGDFSGDYTAWPATYGNHTLTATAYTGSGGSGSVVETRTINFLVKESGTTPPPPPPPSAQITLTLVNAATDANIRDMLNQDTIIYNSGTDKITIKAIPSKTIGSVVFHLDGAHYRTESVAPYALNGDNNGDYTAWPATFGNHTLTATAYTGSGGSGSVVEARTINFLVKESGSTPPPPPPSSEQITFTLVNAVTDQDIGPLVNGQTINLANLPTNKLNIRANSSMANTKSVVFDFDGKIKFRTESAAPYALHGDNSGNYNEWIPPTGTHTLKATPYTSTGGGGTAGVALSISFNVTNSSTMAASVNMYPNPANERVSISLPDDPSENVLVIIYDEAGNKYYEATSQVANGSNDFGIELTHLNMIPGIYFVKIISADSSEKVVKLIKN